MALTMGVHIGHDGGAALCRDGEVLVACQEERLARVKYSNGWWQSVRYCLDAQRLRLSDCDAIVFSNAGSRLPIGYDGGLARWTDALPPVYVVDHHLSHAVGAFCFSSFSEAMVFVGDAGGNDGMTESAFVMDCTRWVKIGASPADRPRAGGLGTTYEAFTNFLGFRDQEAGKTMALAAFARDKDFSQVPLFVVGGDGSIRGALSETHHWGVASFSATCGGYLGTPFPGTQSDIAANIALYIQTEFTKALLEAIHALRRSNGTLPLVLSGGIGLNCVTNQKLSTQLGANKFYAFPVCSDAGLALGNALYGQWICDRRLPKPGNVSLRFGCDYSDADIIRALERHPDTVPPGALRRADLEWKRVSNSAAAAASYLDAGAVVAWWQGRSELGPRALGGRSLLANPARSGLRDELNRKVKEREWFRPFAPSVLRCHQPKILEDDSVYPYMNMTPKVSSLGRDLIPEAVHVDGTARVQTVVRSLAPELHAVLTELLKLGATPAVINTSFNVKEPIVETPGDAIATFLRSSIDVLILDEFVCHRRDNIAFHYLCGDSEWR